MLQLLVVSLLISQTPVTDDERAALAEAGLSDAAVAKLSGDQIHDVLRREAHNRGSQPPAVAIIAVIGTFATFALMIVAVAFAVYRIYRQRSETLRLMVEKGVQIPPELLAPKPQAGSDLRRGLVLTTFGLGLGIFLLAVSDVRGMWTLGLVPLLVGAGYLVAYRALKPDPTTAAT